MLRKRNIKTNAQTRRVLMALLLAIIVHRSGPISTGRALCNRSSDRILFSEPFAQSLRGHLDETVQEPGSGDRHRERERERSDWLPIPLLENP